MKFLIIMLVGLTVGYAALQPPQRSIKNQHLEVLADGATYTGEWEDTEQYSRVKVDVYTDAPGTLDVQFSSDRINVMDDFNYTVESGAEVHSIEIIRKWVRVVYVDTADGASQTHFELNMKLGHGGDVSTPGKGIVDADSNALLVSEREQNLEIAKGLRAGHFFVQKFGLNEDVDTGTVPEDIWDGSGIYTGFPTETETVDIISLDIDDNSSGTGCRTMLISGLDANKDIQSETVSLNGTTGVTSVGIYSRLNRAICLTAGTSETNEGVITVQHTTTTANIFVTVLVGLGQSNVACYTVPNDYTGYLKTIRAGIFDNTANQVVLGLYGRPEGGAAIIQRELKLSTASGSIARTYDFYLVFPEKTDGCCRVLDVQNSNARISCEIDLILIKN